MAGIGVLMHSSFAIKWRRRWCLFSIRQERVFYNSNCSQSWKNKEQKWNLATALEGTIVLIAHSWARKKKGVKGFFWKQVIIVLLPAATEGNLQGWWGSMQAGYTGTRRQSLLILVYISLTKHTLTQHSLLPATPLPQIAPFFLFQKK